MHIETKVDDIHIRQRNLISLQPSVLYVHKYV